jgi:hypothetical protein
MEMHLFHQYIHVFWSKGKNPVPGFVKVESSLLRNASTLIEREERALVAKNAECMFVHLASMERKLKHLRCFQTEA